MIPIVTPHEMAAIDAAAPEPVTELIASAGWAVAQAACRMLGGTYGKRVVVIAGTGNNGADGRVAGQLMARRGVRVTVVDPSGRLAADPEGPGTGHRRAPSTLPPCDLVIDAGFGTGLSRPYDPPRPFDSATPVLAVDIPSGIAGLTGQALGAPLVATRTVTFAALKPGLLIGEGPMFAGEIEVADIGLDTAAVRAHLVTEADVAAWLPARVREAHKWQHAVRIVAGSPGMSGAADLASAGTLRAGAGYVRRSTPGVDPADHGHVPTGPVEAVTTALPSTDWAATLLADVNRFAALLIGPGLGVDDGHAGGIAAALTAPIPVVLDGDGLRALGDDPAGVLASRPAGLPPVVLTPHEGEFRRLGGDLEAHGDRFASVRDLAARCGAVVLLKGSTSLIAHPDGRVLASTTGDSRLATAGTGDVLAGVIAALLARGVAPFEATALAAWIHGRAARDGHRVGLVASDLPGLVAVLLGRIGHNGSTTASEGRDHAPS